MNGMLKLAAPGEASKWVKILDYRKMKRWEMKDFGIVRNEILDLVLIIMNNLDIFLYSFKNFFLKHS